MAYLWSSLLSLKNTILIYFLIIVDWMFKPLLASGIFYKPFAISKWNTDTTVHLVFQYGNRIITTEKDIILLKYLKVVM